MVVAVTPVHQSRLCGTLFAAPVTRRGVQCFARSCRAESPRGRFLPDSAGPSGSASFPFPHRAAVASGRRVAPARSAASAGGRFLSSVDRSRLAKATAVDPSKCHISICVSASPPIALISCLLSELSTAAFDDAQILFTETANDCSRPH